MRRRKGCRPERKTSFETSGLQETAGWHMRSCSPALEERRDRGHPSPPLHAQTSAIEQPTSARQRHTCGKDPNPLTLVPMCHAGGSLRRGRPFSRAVLALGGGVEAGRAYCLPRWGMNRTLAGRAGGLLEDSPSDMAETWLGGRAGRRADYPTIGSGAGEEKTVMPATACLVQAVSDCLSAVAAMPTPSGEWDPNWHGHVSGQG